jgi:hypothetical protein
MKKEKKFGDTDLGQGLGCAAVILSLAIGGCLFIGLLAYISKL